MDAPAKGLPQHVVALGAMVDYYHNLDKQTRPVRRILRDLGAQIRAA